MLQGAEKEEADVGERRIDQGDVFLSQGMPKIASKLPAARGKS